MNMRVKRRDSRSGFTLIELLIVIAIILILIAIALPNFLEAQIRARITKAKSEIRTLGIAMESYFLDFKYYPAESEHDIFLRARNEAGLRWLTSPIAYIAAVPEDPFGQTGTGATLISYEMGGIEKGNPLANRCGSCLVTWVIFTQGPDLQENEVSSADPHWETKENDRMVHSYAPTNGTKSFGDIFQYGGDPFWVGVRMPVADLSGYRLRGGSADVGLPLDNEIYLHKLPPKLR